MNYAPRKLSFWMLAFCLMLTVAIFACFGDGAGEFERRQFPPQNPRLRLFSATPAASAAGCLRQRGCAQDDGQAVQFADCRLRQRQGLVNTRAGVYHKNGRCTADEERKVHDRKPKRRLPGIKKLRGDRSLFHINGV